MDGDNRSQSFFLTKRPYEIEDLYLVIDIEIRCRFIEEHYPWLLGQYARYYYPLPLTSAQLVDRSVRELSRIGLATWFQLLAHRPPISQ